MRFEQVGFSWSACVLSVGKQEGLWGKQKVTLSASSSLTLGEKHAMHAQSSWPCCEPLELP